MHMSLFMCITFAICAASTNPTARRGLHPPRPHSAPTSSNNQDMNPLSLLRNFNWSGSNSWGTVFLDVAKQKGFIFCLYRGMRSNIVANLLPLKFGYFGGGIIETLLFRRMLRPVTDDELADIRDLSRDPSISTHHRITSSSLTAGTRGLFMEAQTMINKHGAWSLMSYFYMSTLQIVPGTFSCVCVCVCVCMRARDSRILPKPTSPRPPFLIFSSPLLSLFVGFFNFLSSRILLFLAFGPSQMRERQLRRRKELLGMFIKNKRINAKNTSAIG